ncbi:C2H2-type zinc finger protein [Aspergillus glaucus CBS 516.65]|uniref:C2H2-type domain-containing protein n=1 Tax=Aspergillus glaucus CBS 516.65 TaxID=1160497 RepID=A0A1L9V4J5_ASPGL|nr:hypothetical protein ASPGLDRAFT_1096179 [Aspergillus glaucus CBS 516.65]OJJ78826.1 hypothetical protein ASPGLDRAFT_1096179 [Aspergillus glaucus CBS 516.65]
MTSPFVVTRTRLEKNAPSTAKDKKHACMHCGRRFRRTEHLDRHMRIHTKEKPFVCHCGASFTRRDLLKRHERICHSSPSEVANFQGNCGPEPPGTQEISPGPIVEIGEASKPQQITIPDQISPIYGDNQHHPGVYASSPGFGDFEGFGYSEGREFSGKSPVPFTPRGSNHFQDFTRFLDSLGFPMEWAPIDPSLLENDAPGCDSVSQNEPLRQPVTRASDTSHYGPTRSRLPYVPNPGQVLASIPEFEHSHSRCKIASLIVTEGFHTHVPCIHIPTFYLTDRIPELILAMMAVGAHYKLERAECGESFPHGKRHCSGETVPSSRIYSYNTILIRGVCRHTKPP